MNDHVQFRSETVDVTPVSMATIWPIIKDRAFLSMKATLIPSNKLEKFSLISVHHKFGQNRTMVKVTEMTKIT